MSAAKTLEHHFNDALQQASDINEHCLTLRGYAAGKRVLELGVRYGVSTRAFLAGSPQFLLSVDIARFEFPAGLKECAAQEGIRWEQRQQDSAEPIPADLGDFDVTFVDTLHNAQHVRLELAAHEPRTREFLIFHDTVTNGTVGDDGSGGILEPIQDLVRTGSWTEWQRLENNNGLLVLKRVQERTGDEEQTDQN